MTRELSPVAAKAKALRQALKAVFPTVKFSVKSDNYSMGSSIDISWTDGVMGRQVKEIASQYESIRYCEVTGEILGGGNCYVDTQRKFTPESYTQAVEQVCKYWGLPMAKVTVSDYDKPYIASDDDVSNVGNGSKRLAWLVDEALAEIDFTQTKAVEPIAVDSESAEPIESAAETQTEAATNTAETEEESEPVDETVQNVLEMRRYRLEERQSNKEEAYGRLAVKHSQESDRRYQSAHEIGSMIPFGQPILVGHHSEGRHRRDLDRIDSNMRKSIEHSKTAQYYEDKLTAMEANTSISSDDPDALIKLTEKLTGMEECQEYMKRINAIVRKVRKLPQESQMAEFCKLAEVDEAKATTFLTPDFCGRLGFPDYATANNNANMKRVRDRIEEIKKQHEAIAEKGESDETEYPDIELKVRRNRVNNRVQLIFNGKPLEAIRSTLKTNGFRWSPSEGAWQRQLNNAGIYATNQVIKFLTA